MDKGFTVVVHGTVESAECTESELAFCRTTLVHGPDWSLERLGGDVANTVDVVTQMAERLPGPNPRFVWNAPFEFVLHSSNAHGWPQIALALTNIDRRTGAEQVLAYARCHVPLRSGVVTLDLPLMQTQQATPQHKVFGALSGPPELRNLSFLCSAEDRIVMSARRIPGHVRLSFHVAVSDMAALNYS
jgi:B9 domain-containing protein 1